MLTLGLLAILSASIVPGAIVLSLTRCPLPLVAKVIAAFFISIAWTHLKVVFLVSTGSFQTGTVLCLFIIECSVLAWILHAPAGHAPPAQSQSWVRTVLFTALLAFTLLIVTTTDRFGPRAFSTVWTHWDTVVSWNRWALDWASNRFPSGTWGYGQLLPTLWAYTYVFNFSRPVEFFAKALTDFFPLLIVVMHLDLILRRYVVAGITGYIGILYFSNSPIGVWAFQALADIPLSASILASVYFAHLASDTNHTGERTYACTLAIFLAGIAAALKQQGFMLLILSPIIFWPFLPDYLKNCRRLSRPVLLACFVAAPFYIVYLWSLFGNAETSNLQDLLDLTAEKSGGGQLAERLAHGFEVATEIFGYYSVSMVLPALLLVYTLCLKRFRRFITLFLIPYIFIWAYGFSYDPRNSLLIYPILTFFGALSIDSIFERYCSKWSHFQRLRSWFLSPSYYWPPENLRHRQPVWGAFAVLLAILFFGQSMTDDSINRLFVDATINKGSLSVNQQLIRLDRDGVLTGRIVTNYEVMLYLPQFADHKLLFRLFEEPSEQKLLIDDATIDTLVIWFAPWAKTDWNLFRQVSLNTHVISYESAKLMVIRRLPAKEWEE